jgi:epoxyqueuosine reductase QueG
MSDTAELKAFLLNEGADLVGVAPVDAFRGKLETIPPDLLDPYSSAVAIALYLDDGIIDAIDEGPTPEYAAHYWEKNAGLNRLAETLVEWIEARCKSARAIPASEKLGGEPPVGSISHKAVARMAGIGWQGKSLLIVNPERGPRIRLATVLTDMPLEPDAEVLQGCGDCTACADACPVGAIRGVPTEAYYSSREEAVDIETCYARTLKWRDTPGIEATICGVCVRACPFGQ